MPDRAILFVDGSNWFHALGRAGVRDRARLDYVKISQKLIGPRTWLATRYYIGQVMQEGNTHLYAQQRTFLASLEQSHPRISIHLGRIEPRKAENKTAKELRQYLASLQTRIEPSIYGELSAIASRHAEAEVYAAYLLTTDGDFTPAVNAARALAKKVYAASPLLGWQLSQAVNAFIHLRPDWFQDCYSTVS
jgi:hypothetical protein